jgi:hypothetical protein
MLPLSRRPLDIDYPVFLWPTRADRTAYSYPICNTKHAGGCRARIVHHMPLVSRPRCRDQKGRLGIAACQVIAAAPVTARLHATSRHRQCSCEIKGQPRFSRT